MTRQSRTIALLVVLCVALLGSRARAVGLQTAVARSKQTGLPMLVLGTTATCPYCKKLIARLSTEPALQQLLTQYVALELKVDDPEFQVWARQFKPKGKGVPMIFIVSAKGEEIYNSSGAPTGDGLNRLLTMGIEKTGGVKEIKPPDSTDPRRERMLAGAVRAAESLRESKKTAEAIAKIKPFLDNQSESDAAKRLAELVKELTEEGRAEMEKAQETLQSEDKTLLGVLALVKTRRIFGALPDLKEPLSEAIGQLRQDERTAGLVEHAELCDRGRAMEEDGKQQRAVTIYREVVSKYPEAPIARLCQIRIAQLTRSAAASRPSAKPTAASGISDVKRADYYLRMAHNYAEKHPDKARQYAQKVIDLLPDTPLAREAQVLISGL